MCLVMDYLPNNLNSVTSSYQGKLDPDLLLQFATDIADGMKYLHSKNIIHRDLKTFNILLDKHLNVKIADLGIARQKTETSTMTTIGTVAWTAPEILRHVPYNEKADVYSYAIVLWECVTGKVTYENMEAVNAGIAVVSQQLRPPLPPDLDPSWSKLIVWCWSDDPHKRPDFTQVLAYLAESF